MSSILPTDAVPCELCGAPVPVRFGKEPARCALCGRVMCPAHTRRPPGAPLNLLTPATCTECTPPRT